MNCRITVRTSQPIAPATSSWVSPAAIRSSSSSRSLGLNRRPSSPRPRLATTTTSQPPPASQPTKQRPIETAGYQDDSGGRTSYGSLSNSSFTYDGTSYTVKAVSWDNGRGWQFQASLRLELAPALDDGLVLHVDTHESNVSPFIYALDDNDGTDSATGEVSWDALFPALEDGDTVTLRLGTENTRHQARDCKTFIHQSEQNQIRNIRAVERVDNDNDPNDLSIQWERPAYSAAPDSYWVSVLNADYSERSGTQTLAPFSHGGFAGSLTLETVYIAVVARSNSEGTGPLTPLKFEGIWLPGPGGL